MKRLIAFFTVLLFFVSNIEMSAQSKYVKGDTTAVSGKDIVDRAMKYIGTPYRSGSMNPNRGFDCSGFTSYIFKTQNIILPRDSRSQYIAESSIDDCRDLRTGDLVFFSGSRHSSRIGHVGIVTSANPETGEFSFIHSSSRSGIVVSSSNEAYYAKRYIGACRILESEVGAPQV